MLPVFFICLDVLFCAGQAGHVFVTVFAEIAWERGWRYLLPDRTFIGICRAPGHYQLWVLSEKNTCKALIMCQALLWVLESGSGLSRQTNSFPPGIHFLLWIYLTLNIGKLSSTFAIYINSILFWHKNLHFLLSDYFYPLKIYLVARPVWLSWLCVILQSKRWLVRSLVRTHAWVASWSPVGGM